MATQIVAIYGHLFWGWIWGKHSAHIVLLKSPETPLDMVSCNYGDAVEIAMDCPVPAGHPAGPHFAETVAVGYNHVMRFCPMEGKRGLHVHS